MEKRSILLSSGVAVFTVVAAASALQPPNADFLVMLDLQPPGARDLLLRAMGTGPVEAGKIRIPIPAEGVTYEVIVKRPGLPRLTPANRSSSD